MTKYRPAKDLLTAFSLSNLCFLSAWSAVIFPPFKGYILPSPPTGVNDLAIMLDVAIFTTLVWASFLLARRAENRFFIGLARATFLFLVVVVINDLIREIFGSVTFSTVSSTFGNGLAFVLVVTLAAFAAFVFFKFWPIIVKGARVVVLLLVPFAFITFFDAGTSLAKNHFRTAGNSFGTVQKLSSENPPAKGTKVVWIIFDEFDYHTAFPSRPETLSLPELDRLAEESVFATNAYSPAKTTFRSLPALISGRLVMDAKQESFDKLAVRFAGAPDFADWNDQPNIFSRLKNEGGRSAIAGWYHPYCRILGRDPTECFVQTNFPDALPNKHSSDLGASMLDYCWRVGLTIPLVKEFLPKFKDFTPNDNFDRNHIDAAKNIRAHALEMVVNPNYSLVMIHFPAPHPPYYYNRHTHDFDPATKSSYFDGLALVDDVLGSVRRTMENDDMWNSSVVIVSADHWWRDEERKENGIWAESETEAVTPATDFRVPFIVKPAQLPGDEEKQLQYDGVFNTVLTQDLILAIHRGEVSSPDQIAAWLDQHRSIGKTDY